MRLPGIVAIDGLDASGKATQAKMLADYLDAGPWFYTDAGGVRRRGETNCLRLAFPAYDTPIGKLIASKLKGEWGCGGRDNESVDEMKRRRNGLGDVNALVLQALMIANKLELACEIERANVVEGRNVVLDRYIVSGIAYGQADGLDRALLETLHARLPKAHHVFIDIPVEESFKRRPKREDKYEANRARLERARKNYLAEFERNGAGRIAGCPPCRVTGRGPAPYYIVDGLGRPDEVHARVKYALEI